jgi:hypothetical protein
MSLAIKMNYEKKFKSWKNITTNSKINANITNSKMPNFMRPLMLIPKKKPS